MSDENEADMADESAATDADEDARVDEGTETETETAEAEDEAVDEGGIQDGDFVRLAYTLRTAEDSRVVDTTDEEVAEEEGLETEGRSFGPRTVVIGAGQMFESVEDAIVGSEVGDEGAVTVPVEEAFGEYDQDQVRTVSTDTIPEDNRYPGAQVQIDGEQGIVEAIYSGRSRVDFNHPLAGEDLEYEYEIVGLVEDRVERARELLKTYFDVELDMHIETDEVEEEVTVEPDEDEEDAEPETEVQTVEKETLYMESNPQLQFNQQWMFSKQQIVQDIIDRVDVDRVIIQEVIESQPAGMPGMGGMGGGDLGDIEAALEEADVDADEIAEELDLGEGEEAAGAEEKAAEAEAPEADEAAEAEAPEADEVADEETEE